MMIIVFKNNVAIMQSKRNILGYSCNPCSLNRERDTVCFTLWGTPPAWAMSEALIESRQFIGWWRDAVSDAITSSAYTSETFSIIGSLDAACFTLWERYTKHAELKTLPIWSNNEPTTYGWFKQTRSENLEPYQRQGCKTWQRCAERTILPQHKYLPGVPL